MAPVPSVTNMNDYPVLRHGRGARLSQMGLLWPGQYRIRRYGDSDVAFLERKLRRQGMLVKRRTQVPLHELERSGDVSGSRNRPVNGFIVARKHAR